MPNSSVYAASKAALRSFARTLSADLVERGIRVNVISPGPVTTPIFGRLGLTPEALDEFAARVRQDVPLRRFGVSGLRRVDVLPRRRAGGGRRPEPAVGTPRGPAYRTNKATVADSRQLERKHDDRNSTLRGTTGKCKQLFALRCKQRNREEERSSARHRRATRDLRYRTTARFSQWRPRLLDDRRGVRAWARHHFSPLSHRGRAAEQLRFQLRRGRCPPASAGANLLIRHRLAGRTRFRSPQSSASRDRPSRPLVEKVLHQGGGLASPTTFALCLGQADTLGERLIRETRGAA